MTEKEEKNLKEKEKTITGRAIIILSAIVLMAIIVSLLLLILK